MENTVNLNLVTLTEIVGVILTLSIASERLAEIIKGLFPYLSIKKEDDPKAEGRRRSALQAISVATAILTAFLAKPYFPPELAVNTGKGWAIVGLGLLASGGSGLWNSILGYMTGLKDLQQKKIKS